MSATAGVRLGLLAYRQWLGWPSRIVERAPGLHGIAGDGHFLLTVPLLALAAPTAVVLGALLAGVSGVGYDVVYTESVLFVTVAVAVGTVSTQLGALGVAAFAVGDVLRAVRAGAPGTASSLTDVVGGWLPAVVTYLLLFAVVVVLPRTIRSVVASVGDGRRIPIGLAWPVAGGLVVVLTWLAVTAWVAAAPTLIRPVFTWTGGEATVEAITTLQVSGNQVVAAALIAAILRHIWVGVTAVPGPWRTRVLAAEGLLALDEGRGGRPGHPGGRPTANRRREYRGTPGGRRPRGGAGDAGAVRGAAQGVGVDRLLRGLLRGPHPAPGHRHLALAAVVEADGRTGTGLAAAARAVPALPAECRCRIDDPRHQLHRAGPVRPGGRCAGLCGFPRPAHASR